MVAFADVPLSAWRYVAGEPRVFASSPQGERRFCPHCGTQIEYRDAGAPLCLSVNLATLDEPGRVTPGFHIWTDSALPWTCFDGGLPRFPRGRC